MQSGTKSIFELSQARRDLSAYDMVVDVGPLENANIVGLNSTIMAYECEVCDASFPRLSQLMQHRRTENHRPKYTCPSCKKSFTRKNNLEQHMKKHEDENNHHCPECLRVFTKRDALDEHFMQHESQSGGGRKRTEQILMPVIRNKN
ncbi:ZN629-like protein [Mya arenaria]|uniref:ZN629-like protein n=1 Tax=Mya arenaria TaxID=6604 RepID=A0ABY7FS67_MYAAR|nr:ZN629-like protein [Mya arenaria]